MSIQSNCNLKIYKRNETRKRGNLYCGPKHLVEFRIWLITCIESDEPTLLGHWWQ